jgi:hypothetical protein
MSHFEIISPTSRWYPHNHEIKNMFGLRWQDKFPREGLAPINVPLKERPRSRKPRRTLAKCPDCERWVCAGHTIQHVCQEDREKGR